MAGGTLKALLVDAYFAPRHERRLFSRQVPRMGRSRPVCLVVQPCRSEPQTSVKGRIPCETGSDCPRFTAWISRHSCLRCVRCANGHATQLLHDVN